MIKSLILGVWINDDDDDEGERMVDLSGMVFRNELVRLNLSILFVLVVK
jgi:hypothetical protein